VGAGAIGHMSEDLGPVLELNPVHAVGQRLQHDPLHERGTLGHETPLYQTRDAPPGSRKRLPTSPQGGEVICVPNTDLAMAV
jgi:hypothetical protein